MTSAILAAVIVGACGAPQLGDVAAEAGRACGVERWPVKIVADSDALLVGQTPQRTTISLLASVVRPAGPFKNSRRVFPAETTLFAVRAVVLRVISEADGDQHVLLADPSNPLSTLVGEIPDSACATGSRFDSKFASARRVLPTLRLGSVVEVEAFGFFDYLHGQSGMAANGIELHPIISLRAATANASR